jgi:hypothetical protein
MNQMEISIALVGLSFGLFLAALAVGPNLIGIYRELRARKRHIMKQNASGAPVTYPTPVPFNYPQMVSRRTTEKK